MKVVGVYSMKGGVGKTAAAVNLAYLASREGTRTVIWDLDPQSSATFYLRVKPKVRGGGKKLMKGPENVESAVKATDFQGLDLLPGDFSYRKLDLVLSDLAKAGKRLRKILDALAPDYDCLFLDCPPGLSVLSEAVLRSANLLLVPTIPTPLCVRTLELIERYFEKHTLDASRVRPFLSMVDRRKNLHRQFSAEENGCSLLFLDTAIPYASQVEQMGIHRSPVAEFAPASPAARAFGDLWSEVRPLLGW